MFESKPISVTGFEHGESGALRAIAWPELTARINAARDLRQVLRRENPCLLASFSDAAAGYFSTLDDGKPVVNPDGLGDRKPNVGMDVIANGDAETGDREK